MSPQIVLPMKPSVLRRRLTLILFGGLLAAATITIAAHAGPMFVLQLAAMLILTGALTSTVLLGSFRVYEWWADR